MKEWYKNLKELREKKGWSQQAFAEKIGVKQSTIAAYEKGRNEPRIAMLIQIAECFNVSLDYLCGIEQGSAEDKQLYRQICELAAGDRYILQRILEAFHKEEAAAHPLP